MKTFALLFGLVFGNNYEAQEGSTVYLQSQVLVKNDQLITNRIVSITEGKKPFTYYLLWVENDEIVLELNN
jgi:hypothetical protein